MLQRKVRFTKLDAVLILLIMAGMGYLVWRIEGKLQYKWEWSVIPQYLVRFDAETGRWLPNLILQGLFTTVRLSIWATILATVIGTLMGVLRASKSLFWRLFSGTYVEIIRNLPPLVLIFIFYFFLSDQLMTAIGVEDWIRTASPATREVIGWLFSHPDRFPAFLSALLTLAVYEGAYITEIVRAGIQSIDKGQWEAAYVLGLSPWQTMTRVILPLTAQRVLPPLSGQFISTIKDSSIVAVISVQELTFQGLELMAATYLAFEVWITVAALYLVLTLGCSLAARRLEVYLYRSEA